MLKTGSLSVGGDEGTWKVAPFDSDILRRPHVEVFGEHGGEGGKATWVLFRVRR
jgi:hypothetical protein